MAEQERVSPRGIRPPQDPSGLPGGAVTVRDSILAAAGVPPGLVDPAGGAPMREVWRMCIFGTIQPVVSLLSAELRRVGLGFGHLV